MNPYGDPDPATGIPEDLRAPADREQRDFEGLRGRVVSSARRNCPAWLRGEVEDIVQNVLVKLLRSSRKSEGNTSFSAVYLERSVYGAVVDEIRRACRRREAPLNDDETIERIPTEREDPERGFSAGEVARGIQECLERLSRPRRLAVTLYLHGCTVPETAERLRWKLKRTESLVYRGLAALRDCLAGKGLRP